MTPLSGMTSERYATSVSARIAQRGATIAMEKGKTMMIDKYNEVGIEVDGLTTLERINANKAKPATECMYPNCEDCDKYHGHYCTVPMVISKQFCRMLQEKLEEMEHHIDELENIVYGEILRSDDEVLDV